MRRIDPPFRRNGSKRLRTLAPFFPASARIVILLALISVAADAGAWQLQPPSQPQAGIAVPAIPSDPEIVRRIDAAVYERTNTLAGYNVKEQYDIYRNGESKPSAQMTLRAVYSFLTGKAYTLLAQSGSEFLRTVVLDKVLAGEREMAKPDIRESVWLTSSNYEMRPEHDPVQMNGRSCLIIELKPLRKSPNLLNGRAWVDAADFTVLRVEGTPSQGISIFTGQTSIQRDYARIDGFAMATHAEARSHSFLLGDTVMKIDYTGYQIERGTPPAWVPSH
jgi:hypothetical protein